MEEKIIRTGKEEANRLFQNATNRDLYVGQSKTVDFEFEGEKYKLTIDAFWEKACYFDYTLKGNGKETRKLVASYF